MRCVCVKATLVALALGFVVSGCGPTASVKSAPAPVERFGDSVAFDTALSWISRPGRFTCPPAYGTNSYRYVADLVAKTGVRHVRERLRWRDVAPTKDEWRPGAYLDHAEMLSQRGLKVAGMFHDAAKYARPDRLLPRDPRATFEFCKSLAETFGERMDMWEFWNEEDIGFTDEAAWEYAAQLKAAALGFRAGGFKGIVAPGALCRPMSGDYEVTMLRNRPMDYVDVINYHVYAAPAKYAEILGELRQTFDAYGGKGKAVVLTECGTNQEGDSTQEGVMKGLKAHSPDQEKVQEEFVVKSQILSRMEGVLRNYFFVFGAFNERGGAKDWGLMRRDGTTKPAVAALTRLMDEVGEGTLAGEVTVPGGQVRAFRFDFPSGESKLVYWRRSELDDGAETVKAWKDEPVACTVPLANGEALSLTAHRRAAYVTLPADVAVARKPLPTGAADCADDPAFDRSVVMRIDFDKKAYTLGGNKCRLEMKQDHLAGTLEIWNLSGQAKVGQVVLRGAGRLEGLPGSVTLPAWDKVALKVDYRPLSDGSDMDIVLEGAFEGRRISPLVVPVFSELKYTKSCDVLECAWKDLKRWTRNTSANAGYACAWDEKEQAVRFTFKWDTKASDRWFFPAYALDLPREDLSRAQLVTYEVKSAQDKVENDYRSARMWVKGKTCGSRSMMNPVPVSTWETRWQDLNDVIRRGGAYRFEFGGHPKGREVTYWIRNIRIYNARGAQK